MKTYTIPEFEISVTINPATKGGVIESNLRKQFMLDDEPIDPEAEASVNALEALILAHACAGLDVDSPAYVEGLGTAVEAIVNHL